MLCVCIGEGLRFCRPRCRDCGLRPNAMTAAMTGGFGHKLNCCAAQFVG